MSEPQKDQDPTPPADIAKLDATAAAAALALAVASAEKSGAKPAEPVAVGPVAAGPVTIEAVAAEPPAVKTASTESAAAKSAAAKGAPKGEAPETATATQAGRAWQARWRTPVAQAAAIAAAVGLGWAAASQGVSQARSGTQSPPEWLEALTAASRQTREDLGQLTSEMRVLKGVVEGLRDNLEEAKGEAAGGQRIVLGRLEQIERAAQDEAARSARAADVAGRIERAGADTAAKLALVSARLDGLERQAQTPTQTPAPVQAAVQAPVQAPVAKTAAAETPTGSLPEPKAARETPLQGWILRDVYGGAALVESSGGRLHEVVPGVKLPNLGRVEAIERRGRTWVVVTAKGVIGVPERWR